MSTTPAVTTGNSFVQQLANPSAASSSASSGEMSDRFMKLLVTQMQNQDPLNPLDNAQVTSQMAQINTVSGIEKLNQSITAMSQLMSDKLGALNMAPSLDKINGTLASLQSQMLQSQATQGAALVGHTVLLEGQQLSIQDGRAVGAFDLSGPADRVVVDIMGPAGQVLDSVELGAHGAGRGGFSWTPPVDANTQGLSFKVRATSGTASVPATHLMADTVQAVSTPSAPGGELVLELARNGSTPMGRVKALS